MFFTLPGIFKKKNKHLFIRMICSFHRLNLFVPYVEKLCAIKYADLMKMDFTYHNLVHCNSKRRVISIHWSCLVYIKQGLASEEC